jgi:hypothetical protein
MNAGFHPFAHGWMDRSVEKGKDTGYSTTLEYLQLTNHSLGRYPHERHRHFTCPLCTIRFV